MKIKHIKYFWILFLGISFGSISAPDRDRIPNLDSLKIPNNWFLLDPVDDHIMGTGVEKAYEKFLKDKSPKQTVIVAVIDSGVDLEHEDLKGKIWVNEDEIPGNSLDDDGNGYVDDVNGWNFIGGADGSHVSEDSHELTREYIRLNELYGDLEAEDIKRRNRKEFAYWEKVKKNFESTREEAQMNYTMYSKMHEGFMDMSKLVKDHFEVEDFKKEDLEAFQTDDEKVNAAIEMLTQLFGMVLLEDIGINEVLNVLEDTLKHFETQAEYAYNLNFNPRYIVGDDPQNYKERYYGNNDPTGPDPTHGTHVAGIIAANRNNNLGMNGIAEHVLIMPIRAVPNGDERDKDIANSIRYATDNGAHIINMSFGKSYSPGKKYVDKAVKYAERKGVILIHAAGNDSKEINPNNSYPNKWFERRGKSDAWLEVGASSGLADENLPAYFSNFSEESVDLFAPGVDIYSTVPGSEYDSQSGTSMAAPTVSGVAALLMAYYPDLKPKEVQEILKQSVHKQSNNQVKLPGQDKTVQFGVLSISGGVVNAYQALKLAESMSK